MDSYRHQNSGSGGGGGGGGGGKKLIFKNQFYQII